MQNENTKTILETISRLQQVQRTNPPTSKAWLDASKQLQPLFAEMARRSNGGQP